MTLTELVDRSHHQAVLSGFHEQTQDDGKWLMLMVSELCEALEALRDGHGPNEVYQGKGGKPEGVPIELADAVIRIADFCGLHGIDLERAVESKMLYNTTRPHRHGGRAF